MKITRKLTCTLLMLMLFVVMAVPVFAATYALSSKTKSIETDHYGTLSGSSSLVSDHVDTTTQVSSNNYNGTVYTKLELSDGISANLGMRVYHSAVGGRYTTDITYLIRDMSGEFAAKYVFTTHEIRGGTEEGDWFSLTIQVR